METVEPPQKAMRLGLSALKMTSEKTEDVS